MKEGDKQEGSIQFYPWYIEFSALFWFYESVNFKKKNLKNEVKNETV